jgi:hypothetical protein
MIATSRVRDHPRNPGWRYSPGWCRLSPPDMAARVVTAVEQRLVIVLAKAEAALDQQSW